MSGNYSTRPKYFKTILSDEDILSEVIKRLFAKKKPLVLSNARTRAKLKHFAGFFHVFSHPLMLPLDTRHKEVLLYLDPVDLPTIMSEKYRRFFERLKPGTALTVLCEYGMSQQLLHNVIDHNFVNVTITENGSLCYIAAVKNS